MLHKKCNHAPLCRHAIYQMPRMAILYVVWWVKHAAELPFAPADYHSQRHVF